MEELSSEDLRKLVHGMQQQDGGVLREKTTCGSTQVFTFPLRAAIVWLKKSLQVEDEKARNVLGKLQAANFVTVCGTDPVLDLSNPDAPSDLRIAITFDFPPPKNYQTLNTQFRWYGEARKANQISESLRRQLLQLYGKYVDDDGKLVDYKAMAKDDDFSAFTVATVELQKVDVFPLSREERLAFFINVYNSLVIHSNVVFKPLPTLLGRLRHFDSIKYNIGGLDYTANDIEHGILRGNAISPTSLGALIGKPQWSFIAPHWFKDSDTRLPLAITPPDPRIHFTLNCGAKSCPAIRVYSQKNLELGLASATKAFVAGEVALEPQLNEVVMSKIFKWYKSDFAGSDQELLEYILPYMEASQAETLQGMLKNTDKKLTIKFKEYDWSINAK